MLKDLAYHDDAGHPGLAMLEQGLDACSACLLITNRVRHTLDVQAAIFMATKPAPSPEDLLRAAARGLRGRGLPDDIYTEQNEAVLIALGSQPTIEVRFFNRFRYRIELLKAAVELHGLKPQKNGPPKKHIGRSSNATRTSVHANASVFELPKVFIGFFSFDPRSALPNTEPGMLIDNPDVAQRVTDFTA